MSKGIKERRHSTSSNTFFVDKYALSKEPWAELPKAFWMIRSVVCKQHTHLFESTVSQGLLSQAPRAASKTANPLWKWFTLNTISTTHKVDVAIFCKWCCVQQMLLEVICTSRLYIEQYNLRCTSYHTCIQQRNRNNNLRWKERATKMYTLFFLSAVFGLFHSSILVE